MHFTQPTLLPYSIFFNPKKISENPCQFVDKMNFVSIPLIVGVTCVLSAGVVEFLVKNDTMMRFSYKPVDYIKSFQ
jgi:hypothetical protein